MTNRPNPTRREAIRTMAGAGLGLLAAGEGLAEDAPVAMLPRRGVNLSHWFAQSLTGKYDEDYTSRHTGPADMALIRSLGLDHVRFTVEPAPLWTDRGDPSRLDPGYRRRIDSALDMILDAGLAVVVDLHPADEFKFPLRDDDKYVRDFGTLWAALAAHLSRRNPRQVALEVINEPRVEDPGRWQKVIAELARAIRDAAPRHTIVACGPKWSGIDDLLALKPLDLPNVVYTFHMYDPFIFTHQGASWAGPEWAALKGVPYPSSPEAVADAIEKTDNPKAKANLKQYGQQRWGADRVAERVGKAADWGKRHGVPLYCGEFGAYRNAGADDRARLLHDIRVTLEDRGIGWAMWDYKGGFSLTDPSAKPGPKADPAIVEALGLKPSAK